MVFRYVAAVEVFAKEDDEMVVPLVAVADVLRHQPLVDLNVADVRAVHS